MKEKTIRADKLLSNLGYGSRKDMGRAIKNGWLEVHGERMTDASGDVLLSDVIAGHVVFDDEPLDPPSPLTIMLNKPSGVTCSMKDAGPIVYDLLPSRWKLRNPIMSPVGRLDKYSTGQLLFTDDGDLLHRVTHPKTHAKKYYRVTLRDTLKGSEASIFSSGSMMLKDEEKPLKLAQWEAEGDTTGVMILSEGRFHQIRRMFEALGNEVVSLHRFQTGGLIIGNLPEGQWRRLDQADINALLTG